MVLKRGPKCLMRAGKGDWPRILLWLGVVPQAEIFKDLSLLSGPKEKKAGLFNWCI